MTYWTYGNYYQIPGYYQGQAPYGAYDYQPVGYPQAQIPYEPYDPYGIPIYPQQPMPSGAPCAAPAPALATPPAQQAAPPGPQRPGIAMYLLRNTSSREILRLKAMLETLADECRTSAAQDAGGVVEHEVPLRFLPDTDAREKNRVARFFDNIAVACHKSADRRTGQDEEPQDCTGAEPVAEEWRWQ